MTYSEEKIDVRGDGRIVLYKRTHLKRPKWQARISVPNSTGYKVLSTHTFDLAEAQRWAIAKYEELYMQVQMGGSLKTKTFKQVFEEWANYATTTLVTTRRGGSWDTTIERIKAYALPYFGVKRIDLIERADFSDYWAWRKVNFNQRPPKNVTLRREATSIATVFNFALSKGYILKPPKLDPPPAQDERRETFSADEWKAIRNSIKDWIEDGRLKATWRDRYYAGYCFLLLANSGIRIGELRKLRWRDLITERRQLSDGRSGIYLSANVTGKRGIYQAHFTPGIDAVLKKIYIRRVRELQHADLENTDLKPDPLEPIFCHPNGEPIKDYKHSFQSLLKYAGVPIAIDGKRRTVYSLRHLYATRRLRKNVSTFIVARQMGTSVEMLEKHYGHVVPSSVAPIITGSEPSDIEIDGGDIELPF